VFSIFFNFIPRTSEKAFKFIRIFGVTDSGEGACVDLGKREPYWEPGDLARQEGEKAGSWLQTAEERRHSKMAKDAGDELATSSEDIYAQSECYCALYSSYTA
jgi:hypothetical protein